MGVTLGLKVHVPPSLQPSFSPGEVIVSMYMYLVISSLFLSLLLHVGERARV